MIIFAGTFSSVLRSLDYFYIYNKKSYSPYYLGEFSKYEDGYVVILKKKGIIRRIFSCLW